MFIEIIKNQVKNINEKVSPDCSDGSGIIPDGPYKGWKVYRTNHIDDIRKETGKERDYGFTCKTFDLLINKFLAKRPLGIDSGEYTLGWKNTKGYQTVVVNISNDTKVISFITVMQLNKKSIRDYKIRGKMVNLGVIDAPK